MSDAPSSTAVAVREEQREVMRPLPPMNDAEVAAAYRTAKAFAEGGLFKDARRAGEAFTKILAGRDLGLTPYEAMSQLRVIEGKIEAGSDLHATKVRQQEGYDYEVWWIKSRTGKAYPPDPDGSFPVVPEGEREAVLASEDDPADLRPTVGCSIRFIVDGVSKGVSTWTVEDTIRAQLEKPRGSSGKVSPHVSYPRSMYFARAITNGVAWYVPEVMGGLRVYGLGEIPRGEDVAAGTRDDPDDRVDTVELPTAVEAVLARARSLGHFGIASRGAAVFALQGKTPQEASQWVAERTRDLNRFALNKRPVERDPEPEPPDAVVVDAEARTVEPEDVATEEELRVARLADPDAFSEAGSRGARAEALQAARAFIAERGEPADEGEVPEEARREAQRRRAAELMDDAEAMAARGEDERAADARAEAEALYEAAGPAPDDQSGIDL